MDTPRARPAVTSDLFAFAPDPDALREALLVLDVSVDATLEEAARRYREAIRDAHPDRRRGSALQQAVATERATQVNAAWAVLRPALEARQRRSGTPADRVRVASSAVRAAEQARRSSSATAEIIAAERVRLRRKPVLIPVPSS